MANPYEGMSAKDLKAQWKRIGAATGGLSGHKKTKELKHLVSCLLDGETVLALSDGNVANKGCLVVVTSSRLLIIRSKSLSGVDETEFGLDHIVGVDVKSGIVLAKILVKTNNENVLIANLAKPAARFIAQKIREGEGAKIETPSIQTEVTAAIPDAPVDYKQQPETAENPSPAKAPKTTAYKAKKSEPDEQVGWFGSLVTLVVLGLLVWGLWSWIFGGDDTVETKVTTDTESSAENKSASEPDHQAVVAQESTKTQSGGLLGTYYVNANSLNQRGTPGGNVVSKVTRGQAVEVTEVRDDWARISKDGEASRWVSVEFLSRVKPEQFSENRSQTRSDILDRLPYVRGETSEPSISSTSETFWVTSDRLTRRTCPSTSCGVVGKYFYREGVTIFEKRGGWGRNTKYYDASCNKGKSDYVDSGQAACSASNGINNGKFAEWVSLQFLSSTRPADPSAGTEGTAKLIGGSDDYRKYKTVFVKAAEELMAAGRCTKKEFEEQGGWTKSSNFPNKPIYFAFCGKESTVSNSNRLYLDASDGRIFQQNSTNVRADSNTSVDSAYKVCITFDNTGLLSEPCKVSGWGSSVNVRINTTPNEARDICTQVASIARKKGWRFDPRWKLNIYSPYSGKNTIAYCNF